MIVIIRKLPFFVLFAFIVPVVSAQESVDFSEPDLSGSNYDLSANPFAQSSGNQCTWYVYGRVRERQGIDLVFTEQTNRNAYRWSEVLDASYRRGEEPLAGAIAVWAPREIGGNLGHVAYVEYVRDDVVYYTEANFSTFERGGGYDGYLKHTSRDTFEGDKGLNGAYKFVTYIYPSDGREIAEEWHSEKATKGGGADDLLGTWYVMEEVSDSFYFGDDGTITIKDSPKVLSGHFRKTGPQQVLATLSYRGRTEEATLDYQIGGDSMLLSIDGGREIRLTRDPSRRVTPEDKAISQLSEGLNLSAGAKAAVTEFYMDKRRLPKDNAEAGLARPEQIRGRYVRQVRVENGLIRVSFGASDGSVSEAIDGKSILLEPVATSGGSVSWICRSEDIKNENLPPACRQ